MKRCSRCQETKPLDDFARHKHFPDGRQSRCKACVRALRAGPRGAPKILDDKTLRRLREAVGLPPDGPDEDDRLRWHQKEMQG